MKTRCFGLVLAALGTLSMMGCASAGHAPGHAADDPTRIAALKSRVNHIILY